MGLAIPNLDPDPDPNSITFTLRLSLSLSLSPTLSPTLSLSLSLSLSLTRCENLGAVESICTCPSVMTHANMLQEDRLKVRSSQVVATRAWLYVGSNPTCSRRTVSRWVVVP